MSLEPVPLAYSYRLLHPKLVVLVVACDKSGKPNPMTAAWAMPVSASPPLVCVSISPHRYTHDLIRETREFTVNVADVEMIKEVHYCGTVSGRSMDKVAATGLRLKASRIVKPPLVENALAALECRLYSEHPAGDHVLFVGEIVAAYARRGVFSGVYDISKARPLFHLGGDSYTTVSGEVLRP